MMPKHPVFNMQNG